MNISKSSFMQSTQKDSNLSTSTSTSTSNKNLTSTKPPNSNEKTNDFVISSETTSPLSQLSRKSTSVRDNFFI